MCRAAVRLQGIAQDGEKGGGDLGGGAVKPHRFQHRFGTEVTRRGVDPLFSKELMGIQSDRVSQRYTKGVFKEAAAEAYLRAIGEHLMRVEARAAAIPTA